MDEPFPVHLASMPRYLLLDAGEVTVLGMLRHQLHLAELYLLRCVCCMGSVQSVLRRKSAVGLHTSVDPQLAPRSVVAAANTEEQLRWVSAEWEMVLEDFPLSAIHGPLLHTPF